MRLRGFADSDTLRFIPTSATSRPPLAKSSPQKSRLPDSGMKPRAAFFPGVRLPNSRSRPRARAPFRVPWSQPEVPGPGGKILIKPEHLPKEIQVPVARQGVGAQAQVHPGLKQVRHRRRPGAGVAVGPGTQHQPGPGRGQEVAIRRGEPESREPPGSGTPEIPGPRGKPAGSPRGLKFRDPASPAFQQALEEAVASRPKSPVPPGIRPGAPSGGPDRAAFHASTALNRVADTE